MVGKRPLTALLYRTKWVVPVVALALASLSVVLGQVARAHILAVPDQPISFVIEDGLPYDITQEKVEAAAKGRALSYEPFTIMVVDRKLTWQEYTHGRLPQGIDVMLSIGIDEDDLDLAIPNASRASVAKLASNKDWRPNFNAASDIRQTFLNNLTQGQRPSAVVGAAMTAASVAFDGGSRSPVFWVSVAALPLLVGLLMMVLWARYLARERGRKRVFSQARLELARVVLELDLLDVHVTIADAELGRTARGTAKDAARNDKGKLEGEWSAIHKDSVNLAHQEQVLARELIDPLAAVHERGAPTKAMDLAEFAASAAALRRRVDALIASSSLRVGHASGGTILGQIALSCTLPIDEILQRRDVITEAEAETLNRHRGDLLALVHEAENEFGSESGPDVVARHADLLQRWRQVEGRLSGTLTKVARRFDRLIGKGIVSHIRAGVHAQRVQDRARLATGGAMDSLDELRQSLDLTNKKIKPPSHVAERVLLQLAAIDETNKATTVKPHKRVTSGVDKLAPNFTPLAVVGLPIVLAVIAGFTATSTMAAGDKSYGRTLVGDQPLAALSIVGDPALLPQYADPKYAQRRPSNIETLTLDQVRKSMASNAQSPDLALLPERLELVVALLPLEEYVTVDRVPNQYRPVQIDFFDLMNVYPRIMREVAAAHPETLNPVTGEVNPGHAILPLWIDKDGSYGVGLALTGTLSIGVNSRLGAYYFVASEPTLFNQPGTSSMVPAGSLVASKMSDLGRELEYNNLRTAALPASTLFWTVAFATWTGAQALGMAIWSIMQLLLRSAGSGGTRKQLRSMREKLNRLALGLDLARLDAVAVLGNADGHRGNAAEADQQLYESVLFAAWREVQTLETLPRREQRGPQWRARVERMQAAIDALTEREAAVAERAVEFIRGYS